MPKNKIVLTIGEMKRIYSGVEMDPAGTVVIQGIPIVVWYLGFLIREYTIIAGLPDDAVVEFSGQGDSREDDVSCQ